MARQPFRFPHDRTAIADAEKIGGEAAARVLREERDRALEDYVSTVSVNPNVGQHVSESSASWHSALPNNTFNVEVDDGVYTASASLATAGSGLSGTALIAVTATAPGYQQSGTGQQTLGSSGGSFYTPGSITVVGPATIDAPGQIIVSGGSLTSAVTTIQVTRIA